MNIEKFLELILAGKEEKKAEEFLKFVSSQWWESYNEYLMNKVLIAENEVKSWNILLANAKENKPFEQKVDMPTITSIPNVSVVVKDVKGLSEEFHGLKITIGEDGKSFTISGTPNLDSFRNGGNSTPESTYDLTICYAFEGLEIPGDRPALERKVSFIINQDPRKLWKNLPVDWDNMPEPKYQNEDTQVEYIKVEALKDGTPQKDIVAASKRGRSHAQEGKPRDDHFRMYHDNNTNWYVLAVADGAGSAKFSRQGSTIACNTVVEHCKAELENCDTFEENINLWHLDQGSADAAKIISADVYRIVGNAAYKAHRAINEEAKLTGNPAKFYNTTLLFAICKKFEFGWFVASFWVGDGAMCLYDKENHTATILGEPDGGEYAGQTRFLTMPEIFKDGNIYQRLRIRVVPDFTALFLMSDGVSDPMFETDANLLNPDKWDALWNNLQNNEEHPVDLSDDHEESKNELLDWLDFWSPGNHDDRTIAILY